jgi:hypothetical protein
MRAPSALLSSLVIGAFAGTLRAEPLPAPGFMVIVHPGNESTQVTSRFLSQAFLKKTRIWPNGTTILPVDQVSASAVRARFAERVLSRSVSAVKNYWQQMIFSGREVPPLELTTDAAVVEYVLKNPGALGYVSAAAELGTAKVLRVE